MQWGANQKAGPRPIPPFTGSLMYNLNINILCWPVWLKSDNQACISIFLVELAIVYRYLWSSLQVRGKRFTVCTEIMIILGTVRFMIRGGRLRYDAHFKKKSSVELLFSSFGDHLINILRKVNRLIYAFKIN